MGIRFACHVCNKKLNIKRELGGRRGVCPQCAARFRIPLEDRATSYPVDVKLPPPDTTYHQEAGERASAFGMGATTANATPHSSTAGASIVHANSLHAMSAANGSLAVAEESDSSGDCIENSESDNDHPSADVSILDKEATWYVRPPSGGQYGPADASVFEQWIAEGRVASTALVWRDGWAQWKEAADVLPQLASRRPVDSTRPPEGFGSAGRDDISELGGDEPVSVQGQADYGQKSRSRSIQRAGAIALLGVTALLLVVVLIVLVNR